MTLVLLAARLVAIAVFIVSGTAKLADPEGTRRALKGFGLGDDLAALGRWGLPFVELVLAALLLGATTAWWGSLGALALLAAFSAAIGLTLHRGRQPECHCFGQLSSAPISATTLIRNAVLTVPPLVVLTAGWNDAGPSALTWIEDLSGSERVLLALFVGLAAAVVALLIGHRRVSASVKVLEALFDEHLERKPTLNERAAPPSPNGLPVGAPLPEATLQTLQGELVTVGSLCQGRAPIALVFVSGDCPACTELIEALDDKERRSANGPEPMLIMRGSPTTNAELLSRHSRLRMLFDGQATVAESFRAVWTPAAVLVSADRTVASDTRFGKAAIEALLTHSPGATGGPGGASTIGERIPSFSAVDDGGRTVGHEVLAGSRVALLYWSPTCGYCKAVEGEFSHWARKPPPSAPRVVLLTQHTAPLRERFGADTVITDTDGAIARSFGLIGTPSAVLISADGTIASAVGVGADDVKALLGGFELTR